MAEEMGFQVDYTAIASIVWRVSKNNLISFLINVSVSRNPCFRVMFSSLKLCSLVVSSLIRKRKLFSVNRIFTPLNH